jgi:hypothetical protein
MQFLQTEGEMNHPYILIHSKQKGDKENLIITEIKAVSPAEAIK